MAGISITLAGNFTKLDELKDKAGKTASSIKSAFGSDLGKKMFGGVAVAATAAFAGVVAAVKSAIDAGGELNDMMGKTGASGKNLLILQKAFQNAGLSAGDVVSSISRMQKALAGVNEDGEPTNKTFEKLGLSIAELTAMDPGEALLKIGQAIGDIENPAQRTAAAMALFGKSGANLNAVFTDSGAIEQAKTQLGSLVDMFPEMAADADTVGDAFGSIDDKMKQLGAGALKQLMPQLLALAKWMNETDFVSVGEGIGAMASAVTELGKALAKVMEYDPVTIGLTKLADATIGKIAFNQKMKGQDLSGNWANENNPYVIAARKKEAEAGNAPAVGKAVGKFSEKDRGKENKELEEMAKVIQASKDKAKADSEAAEAKEKARAAALDEYKLEKAIAGARISGNSDQLAKLEREKAIREEMNKLERAGWTNTRKVAESKVDDEIKATAAEDARKLAEEERQKIKDTLEGKLVDVQDRMNNQQYESSLGAVSDMQRVGGGGGAVSSGLDYARQAADLQREANEYLRQLIEVSRQDTEV